MVDANLESTLLRTGIEAGATKGHAAVSLLRGERNPGLAAQRTHAPASPKGINGNGRAVKAGRTRLGWFFPMAEDLGHRAERLFEHFMAPLVLGGELRPGRPIGGKAALELGIERTVTHVDLASHVELARVRVARQLAPIDYLPGPDAEEWALAAVLHDLVQAAHPDWRGFLRSSSGPTRLLRLAELTLDRVGPVSNVREALGRHTWFSRLLEITRTDTKVSWWVGSQTFLGTEPPARLSAWPELRRVHVDRTPQKLLDLPGAGGQVTPERYAAALARFLRATPLTDMATCARPSLPFEWSGPTLAFVAMRGGRTLALRALAHAHPSDVDAALGRATRALALRKATQALTIAVAFLGERGLASAQDVVLRGGNVAETNVEEALFARSVGAYGARMLLDANPRQCSESERTALRTYLVAIERAPYVQPVAALLTAS